MLKRITITTIVIVLCNSLFAQMPTATEIKAKKIKKITVRNKEANGSSRKEDFYYDANGNDTATYYDDVRSSYKTIEYNKKAKPFKITEYSKDGKEQGVTICTYKSDGSSTSIYTDAMFGMKNTSIYNKSSQLLQYTIPDGTILKNVYNNKGLLTKKYSIPNNGGVSFTTVFTYNSKKQLILEKRIGEYASAQKYEYDSKGLLKTSYYTSEEYTSTATYEYSY